MNNSQKIRVADFIAQFLVEKGVKDIFVLTGHGAMYLNDAIVSRKDLTYYCSRHEATAALMAEAYARYKGELGAICVTAGPGSTNVIPGLAEAWVDNASIIIISGEVPRRHTTRMAKVPGLRSFGTAEVDTQSIVSPMTKYAVMVDDPKLIRYHLEKATYLALSGKPGPVWLDIPLDVQSSLVNPEKLKGFNQPKERINLHKINTQLAQVIKLLKCSKYPLIVAGGGIRQSKTVEEFNEFSKILNIPIIFSRMGIDIMPYSNPLNMGLGGIRGNKHSYFVENKADLVLSLGSRLAIPLVGYDLEIFNPRAKIISVDIDPAEHKKPGVKLTVPITLDLNDFFAKTIPIIKKEKFPDWSEWTKECQNLKKQYPMITPDLKRDPIDLYYFMSRLSALGEKKHIYTSDSGSNYYIAGQIYEFEKNQREISSIGFGAMGLTIPLAVGASIADPSKQVLGVTGDGSLELNIQDLKTISFYNLDIKLFVINNGGYASMKNWQDKFFKGRRIGADDKSGVGLLNLKNIAKAFDMPYDCIKSYKTIDKKLKQIFKKRGPLFVEVFCRSDQKIIAPVRPNGEPNYAG